MLKGFTHGRLACGCQIGFREGVEGSPVTVVVTQKGAGCVMSLHVRDLPLYDYREAIRPPTRFVAVEPESIRLRVWERGVGETMACGSGMVAAAAVERRRHA